MNIIYIILAIILFIFWVIMLVDALKSDSSQKGIWLAVIVIPLALAILFFFLKIGVPWLSLILLALGGFAYNFIKRGR